MIELEIDGKPLRAQPGSMIIEVADKAGIAIPRFCYHKKLSIAANCRMCLVDVEKAPKPLPACATPVTAGMKVYTQSAKARDAQRSVMEFLLINHPLDCPICDQGGECELQDLSLGYGKDISRFNLGKRSVEDDDLGPLIATEMTRCIHCTRCVRFGQEIAGIRELGATGRGEDMQIGTYIKHSLESELSGNIIDLCPVGALTSKPFRFTARAWELQQVAAVAPHDCVGSNIYIHTRRQEVMRVVPRENEALNETWLADRDRYSYLAIHHEDRLLKPIIKQNGRWQETDWSTAFAVAVMGIKKILAEHEPQQLGALISPSATTEELFLWQKLVRALGSNTIDHRLHQMDFRDQNNAAPYPDLGIKLEELDNQDTILLIGSNVQREQPIVGQRVRKASLRGCQVLSINLVDHPFNFAQAERIITTPNQLTTVLAGVTKVLMAKRSAELKEIRPTEAEQALAERLKNSKKTVILLGALAQNHPEAAVLRALAQMLADATGAKVGYLTEGANSAGAWLAGAIPHRGPAAVTVSDPGLSADAALTAHLRAYFLFGIEPTLDCANPVAAETALAKANLIIAFSPFKTENLLLHADVIFPIGTFAETAGTYINMEGDWQSFAAAIKPVGEARPGWKVLRVLANQLNLAGFEYATAEEIRDELRQLVNNMAPPQQNDFCLSPLKNEQHPPLMRITEWPIYAVDSMVRRAEALQNSATNEPVGVYMNAEVANSLQLNAEQTVTVTQDGGRAHLSVIINERIPPNCVWIPAGHKETAMLGSNFGEVEIHG